MKGLLLSLIFCWKIFAQVPPPGGVTSPAPQANKKYNCIIQVTSYLKSGSTKVSYRKFQMKNKEKCEKMNRILSDNFSTKDVTKVEAAMNWSENEK